MVGPRHNTWGPYVIVFLVSAVLVLALNLPHEAFHWIGFHFTGIDTCVHWNRTNPPGGLYPEPKYLWGTLSGPLFNLAFGAVVLSAAYMFRRTGFPLVAVASSWAIRPLNLLAEWVAIKNRASSPWDISDERLVHLILAGANGNAVGWTVALAVPAACLAGILFLAIRSIQRGRWGCIVATPFGALVGMVVGRYVVDAIIGDIKIWGTC